MPRASFQAGHDTLQERNQLRLGIEFVGVPREAGKGAARVTLMKVQQMDLRDWFAGQAITGLLAKGGLANEVETAAKFAYEIADRLLKVREQPPKK